MKMEVKRCPRGHPKGESEGRRLCPWTLGIIAPLVAKQVRRDSILEADLFVVRVAARPVDLSEDGHKIAVFVDVPEKRIQMAALTFRIRTGDLLPLGNCYPDEILFLQGGDELVTLEHRKAGGTSCVSLWNVGSGQRVAKHDFDYMTVNSFCSTGASRLIALGLN